MDCFNDGLPFYLNNEKGDSMGHFALIIALISTLVIFATLYRLLAKVYGFEVFLTNKKSSCEHIKLK